ncbi:head-tail connector protein [Castellaniella sp. UC4442_H9]
MLRCISDVLPDAEPVTVAQAKELLRIDDDIFDAQLPTLIASAREVVERQTGWALVAADYEWTPVGDRRAPLPLLPATVTSGVDVYPVLLTTSPTRTPVALRAAIVLLVGDALRSPEAAVSQDMVQNPAFERLIWAYRRMDM